MSRSASIGDMNIVTVKDTHDVGSELSKLIRSSLEAGRHTLWLISGGSSIEVAYEVSRILSTVDCSKLSISLVDEKINQYEGGVSNMQQLLQTGFYIPNAELIPILREGTNLSEAAFQFESSIKNLIERADTTIGQFGIGEGYHTGGILAHSPAITDETYTAFYASETAEHITVTTKLISLLDIVFINSMGLSKKPLVEHFLESNNSIEVEPTQALKQAKRTVLCTDVVAQ